MDKEETNLLRVLSFTQLQEIDEQQASQINELQFNPNDVIDDQIPQIWEKLEQFSSLNSLMIDFFDCKNIKNISNMQQLMKKMSQLKKLVFSFRFVKDLDEQSISEIANSLENLSNLSHIELDFYSCENIRDYHISDISRFIQQINELKYLNLQLGWNSQLTTDSFPYILPILSKHKHLESLDISLHYLDFLIDLGSFAEILSQLTQLSSFSLTIGGCTKIPDQEINNIFTSLKNLTELKYLYLCLYQCQNVTDQTITQLGNSLKSCQKLSDLYLDLGYLQIENIQDLSESLKCLNIIDLFIDLQGSSNTSNKTIEMFVKNIKDLTNLLSLTLHFCILDADILIQLRKSLNQQKKIRFLNLKQTHYSKSDNLDKIIENQKPFFLRIKYLIMYSYFQSQY